MWPDGYDRQSYSGNIAHNNLQLYVYNKSDDIEKKKSQNAPSSNLLYEKFRY